MPLILPVKVEAQFGFFHAGSRDPLTVTPDLCAGCQPNQTNLPSPIVREGKTSPRTSLLTLDQLW